VPRDRLVCPFSAARARDEVKLFSVLLGAFGFLLFYTFASLAGQFVLNDNCVIAKSRRNRQRRIIDCLSARSRRVARAINSNILQLLIGRQRGGGKEARMPAYHRVASLN
jgi:hypothetical protein